MSIKKFLGTILNKFDTSSSQERKEYKKRFILEKFNLSSSSDDDSNTELQKQFTEKDKDFLSFIVELNNIYQKTGEYLANKCNS